MKNNLTWEPYSPNSTITIEADPPDEYSNIEKSLSIYDDDLIPIIQAFLDKIETG